MAYTISGGYGQLDSILIGSQEQSDKAFVVCPSTHPAYNKLIQAFVGDPDGQNRFFTTVQAAVNAAAITGQAGGNVIYVAEGFYDETVTITTGLLKIVGLGGRGATGLAPTTAGAEGMQISGCDDVTLVNFGVAGDDTSDYALNLHDVSRFRAYACKFEKGSGAGSVVLLDGTASGQEADCLFRDCEFAWGTNGVVFDDSAYGYPTEIFFENCRFHNLTGTHMLEATGGAVVNLSVLNCSFELDETGTKPSDYINIVSANSNGIFSRNSFALATNASADLKIATNIFWVANLTEAGTSTARPA